MGGAASHHDNELVLDVLGLDEAAFAVNGAHQIVAWNDGAERVFGMRAEDVIGRRCFEALIVHDHAACRACQVAMNLHIRDLPMTPTTIRHERLTISAPDDVPDGARNVGVTTLAVQTREGEARYVHLVSEPHDESTERGASAQPSSSHTADHEASSPMLPLAESGSKQRRPEMLTQRELEVLRLLGAGHSTDAIAQELSIARVTARNHVNKVLDKLGVNSRLQAVVIASQLQLL